MEQNDKKAKIKSLISKIMIFLIMVALSIAMSSVNLTQRARDFMLSFLNFAIGETGDSQSANNEVVVKGQHVQIRANEIYRMREIFEILDMDNSSDYAIKELKKIKTLSYYGEKAAYTITNSDIDHYVEKLKEKLKDSNEFKYNAMLKDYNSEKDYGKVMRNLIKEKLLCDRTLEEKRAAILKQSPDTDIDKKLDEYVDNLIAAEKFR